MVKWLPLEANPEVLNEYSVKLGMPCTLAWTDVLAFEDWAMEMVPQPCYAVTLVFPITDASEAHAREEERCKKPDTIASEKVWYTKQTVGNACGTVAVVHTLANLSSQGQMELIEDSFMINFMKKCEGKNPMERAHLLEEDDKIECAHAEAELQGQSNSNTGKVETHFITFVEVDGFLYELDGRKDSPTNHGKLEGKTVLQKAVEVATQFRDRDPEDVRFAMLALAPAQEPELAPAQEPALAPAQEPALAPAQEP